MSLILFCNIAAVSVFTVIPPVFPQAGASALSTRHRNTPSRRYPFSKLKGVRTVFMEKRQKGADRLDAMWRFNRKGRLLNYVEFSTPVYILTFEGDDTNRRIHVDHGDYRKTSVYARKGNRLIISRRDNRYPSVRTVIHYNDDNDDLRPARSRTYIGKEPTQSGHYDYKRFPDYLRVRYILRRPGKDSAVLRRRTQWIYPDGRVYSEKVIDRSGDMLYRLQYEYDAYRRLKRLERYDRLDRLTTVWEYGYRNNRMVRRRLMIANDIDRVETFTYDRQGRLRGVRRRIQREGRSEKINSYRFSYTWH